MLLHRSRGHHVVWQSTLYFLPVYLTGMWASAYRERILSFVGRHRWLIGGAAFVLWLYQITHHQYGGPIFSLRPFSTESGLVDLDLLTKLMVCLLALELLRKYDAVVRDRLRRLGETSFGIFFVHGPVLACCRRSRAGACPARRTTAWACGCSEPWASSRSRWDRSDWSSACSDTTAATSSAADRRRG